MAENFDCIDEINRLLQLLDYSAQPQPNAAVTSADITKPTQQSHPIILATNESTSDASYRPVLPPGHTNYSWSGVNPDQYYMWSSSEYSQIEQKCAEQSEEKQAPAKSQPAKAKKQPQKEEKKGTKQGKGGAQSGKKQKQSKGNAPKKVASEQQSSTRKDALIAIQNKIQSQWAKDKVFEGTPDPKREKFLVTFPYPYMNGTLHLGHAFTITKAEFAAGYQRMKGKNVLFPFSFHCTGMPIAACAQRIEEEINQFGNPPQFPQEEEKQQGGKKAKRGKGKASAKKGTKKYQWQIMQTMGFKDNEIAKFADPKAWLAYFPKRGMADLQRFGLKADWRRSFITTNINPFYNSFIEWQFWRLKEAGKIKFGNRPCVFSPKDKQPCADHDRASGETVAPQQYTLIKMEVLNKKCPIIEKNGDKLAPLFQTGKKVYCVAATLRPETMYGQTNCFVLPRGKYIAITVDNDIYICSEHSARNMAWQGITKTLGEFETVLEIEGWDLLGRALKAPNCPYDEVYMYPLLTIKMDKGTGIVTSVPSDAPSDYAALRDAQNDKKFREKHYLTDEMVLPFKVVPIIRIEQFDSDQSAVKLVEEYGVKSQKDEKKLEEIKTKVYRYGFSHGTMLVGDFKGMKVSLAKDKVQKQMVDQGQARLYWEPEETVMSRTGSKCVVAFTDQWFLRYGEETWKAAVKEHINKTLETFNPVAHDQFMNVIEWLHEWACSREFGLGTHLPWDRKWVIESLSDSTIYMAFYTVCHHFLNGSFDGSASKLSHEDFTREVWDSIFLGKPLPKSCKLQPEMVETMRKEFEYWYPMDLRVSGKDLIFNHLTMSLYNHAAIWENDSAKWPRGFYTNGHVMVDGGKMSKSLGNFLTLSQTIDLFSTDATRFALADAGDTLEDANFARDVANAAILKLTRLETWIDETLDNQDFLRKGAYSDLDKMFENAMNNAIVETDKAYSSMLFRIALAQGYHILERCRNYYCSHIEGGPHKDLIMRYIEVQILLLTPIAPHFCEHMWKKIGRSGYIVNAAFPEPGPVDLVLTQQFEFLQDSSHRFRQEFTKSEADRQRKLKKAKKMTPELENAANACIMCVADEYKPFQKQTIAALSEIYDPKTNSVPEKFRDHLFAKDFVTKGDKKGKQAILGFANYLITEILPQRGDRTFDLKLPFDEYQFSIDHVQFLLHGLSIQPNKVHIQKESDPSAMEFLRERTFPGKPATRFVYEE